MFVKSGKRFLRTDSGQDIIGDGREGVYGAQARDEEEGAEHGTSTLSHQLSSARRQKILYAYVRRF